jgi:hypothetical protein
MRWRMVKKAEAGHEVLGGQENEYGHEVEAG